MRTSGAYLAADYYRLPALRLREALREPGPPLPAGTAHLVDTRVDTGRSVPRQRPGQPLTNVDIEAAKRRSPGAAPVRKC